MTNERYAELMSNDELSLTDDEIKLGWHFCGDWDSLLIGPGCIGELSCCSCDWKEINGLKERSKDEIEKYKKEFLIQDPGKTKEPEEGI